MRLVTCHYVPFPNKRITCGPPVALSVTATLPCRTPVADGVKITLRVQAAPAESDVTHPEAEKSPVAAAAVMVNVPVPVFVTVTVLAALATPLAWLPKFTLTAEKPIAGAFALPVPNKRIRCGLPEAESTVVIVPHRAPARVGVKVTLIV